MTDKLVLIYAMPLMLCFLLSCMLCDVSLLSLIPIVLVKSFAATLSLRRERGIPYGLVLRGTRLGWHAVGSSTS